METDAYETGKYTVNYKIALTPGIFPDTPAIVSIYMDIDFLHTIQQGWRNPYRGPDAYNVNIYGKIRARRPANRQNNHLMLAQQARNLKRHLSKCHGKDLDPRYNAHLCSKLQYNYITL